MTMTGYEHYLYLNTGSEETPTWTEIDLAKDVTINKEKGEIVSTCRATAREGWEVVKEGLKKYGIDFDSLKPSSDETNTAFTALETAYLENTSVDIVVADGASSGTSVEGVRVSCGVFGGSEGQPLNDMATISYSLKANAVPEFGTFTSGTWTADS